MSIHLSRCLIRSFDTALLLAFTSLALATVACGSGGGDDAVAGDGGSGNSGGSNGTGGSGGGGTGGTGGTRDIEDLEPEPEADWTIFVYGHGDHNLSNSLLADLSEMVEADLGGPGDVNLLVLTDWDASQTVSGTGERFPEGIQLFRIPGGGADLEVIAEGPEHNLDDPSILTSVVRDVFLNFPAKRRGVVLWDHGGGWSGGFGSDTQNGTVTPTAMPAEAIPPAVAEGLAAAGAKDEPPLDFFAFDTCLMAGAEVAYPFRDLTKVYIANAEIDYGAGWDYTATLSYIADNLDASATEIARAEVDHWDAHHEAAGPNDALLRSHVALDMSKIDAFADAAAEFTSSLANSDGFEAVELGRAGFFSLPPYSSQFESGSNTPGLRDAGQLFRTLSRVESDASVASAAEAANDALADLVLARSHGALRSAAEQVGIHVELSLASQITGEKAEQYDERAAAWVEASGWSRVLETLTEGADAEAPTSEHAIVNAEGASRSAPPVLQFRSDSADIARAAVYIGQIYEDAVMIWGLVGSGIVEAGTDYEFAWDGAVALFPDGQPAMFDIWLDSGSDSAEPVLSVPMVLEGAAEEPLAADLVFSPSEGSASVAVVSLGSVGSTMSLAEIAAAAPSATLTPVYYMIDTFSGNMVTVQGDPMPLPADGTYPFALGYHEAGNYLLLNLLSDVWGNVSSESDNLLLLEPLGP